MVKSERSAHKSKVHIKTSIQSVLFHFKTKHFQLLKQRIHGNEISPTYSPLCYCWDQLKTFIPCVPVLLENGTTEKLHSTTFLHLSKAVKMMKKFLEPVTSDKMHDPTRTLICTVATARNMNNYSHYLVIQHGQYPLNTNQLIAHIQQIKIPLPISHSNTKQSSTQNLIRGK